MQISYEDIAAEPTTLRIPVSNIVKTGLISAALWCAIIWAVGAILH